MKNMWCYQLEQDEGGGFLGPFGSIDECQIFAAAHHGPKARTPLQCRRVLAGGLADAKVIVSDLNDDPECIAYGNVWAEDWEDEIFVLRDGAQEALERWADRYILVRAYRVGTPEETGQSEPASAKDGHMSGMEEKLLASVTANIRAPGDPVWYYGDEKPNEPTQIDALRAALRDALDLAQAASATGFDDETEAKIRERIAAHRRLL